MGNKLLREVVSRVEGEAPALTDEGMKKLVPMFVKGQSPHTCGDCAMRYQEGDKKLCTIMEGEINHSKGTCAFWTKGKAAKSSDAKEYKMPQEVAGYIEQWAPIQCSTCKAYSDDYCRLWGGKVKDEDCCMAYHKR